MAGRERGGRGEGEGCGRRALVDRRYTGTGRSSFSKHTRYTETHGCTHSDKHTHTCTTHGARTNTQTHTHTQTSAWSKIHLRLLRLSHLHSICMTQFNTTAK